MRFTTFSEIYFDKRLTYNWRSGSSKRFQVGITGLSYLKHVHTIDGGLIHIQKLTRFQLPNSTQLQRTTASDPSLKPQLLPINEQTTIEKPIDRKTYGFKRTTASDPGLKPQLLPMNEQTTIKKPIDRKTYGLKNINIKLFPFQSKQERILQRNILEALETSGSPTMPRLHVGMQQ